MPKYNKIACIVLLGLIVCAAGITGCDGGVTAEVPDENLEPFITDRVVTVRIVMKEEDWDYCKTNAEQEKYVVADFYFDGELVPSVAVRPKGSSTLKFVVESGSYRLSFKVDFNRVDRTCTFRGLKKLNFHNGFRDPTLIRERLAYELFTQMGVPAPRTSHVDLWVNDTHLGVYTQVEQIDKTFLGRHFSNNNGNLYKPIIPAAYLNWTGTGQLNRMRLKTNENRRDHRALLRFLEVLNNEPDETFPEEIEKVLDVDKALRYIAVSTVAGHLDSYIGLGHNYYLYEDNGKFTIIPWDTNEAFGTYKCGTTRDGVINYYIDEPTCAVLSERPLVQRLLAHKPYLDTYREHIKTMLAGPFSFDVMESRIDKIADMIRPFVIADELKFFSTADFELNLTHDVSRYIGLKSFITKRGESVSKQLIGELPSAGDGSGNADSEWQSQWKSE